MQQKTVNTGCTGLLLVLQQSTSYNELFLRQGSLKVAMSSGLALNSLFSLPSAATIETRAITLRFKLTGFLLVCFL